MNLENISSQVTQLLNFFKILKMQILNKLSLTIARLLAVGIWNLARKAGLWSMLLHSISQSWWSFSLGGGALRLLRVHEKAQFTFGSWGSSYKCQWKGEREEVLVWLHPRKNNLKEQPAHQTWGQSGQDAPLCPEECRANSHWNEKKKGGMAARLKEISPWGKQALKWRIKRLLGIDGHNLEKCSSRWFVVHDRTTNWTGRFVRKLNQYLASQIPLNRTVVPLNRVCRKCEKQLGSYSAFFLALSAKPL